MTLSWRMEHDGRKDRRSGRRLPSAAEPTPTSGLVVGCGNRALRESGSGQEELRRLAFGLVAIRLAEAAADVRRDRLRCERVAQARSTRTALTLNSGVPM